MSTISLTGWTSSTLISFWETANAQQPFVRALTLVALLIPRSMEDLMQLSLGQRNFALLKLREQLFGPTLDTITPCLHCQESVELQLDTQQMLHCHINDDNVSTTRFPFQVADYHGECRPLTSFDLESIAQLEDAQLARQQLARRCLLSLNQHNEPIAATSLSDEVIAEIERTLSEVDPLAEIFFELTCPSCQNSWISGLDIAEFLWEELQQKARSLLVEIHWLASAYGWSEIEILALSDVRRSYYLEMIRG